MPTQAAVIIAMVQKVASAALPVGEKVTTGGKDNEAWFCITVAAAGDPYLNSDAVIIQKINGIPLFRN